MDEDAIDVETLQAQIDLSMSFAKSLVSSWIQPHRIPKNAHKKDLEKELSEYMQRPARLGVGASIPEGYNSASREATRLKGKLAGTKHSREEDDDIASQHASDTEGESRVIAIKPKPKYDPFDVVHGKKKKKDKDIDHEDANLQLILANSNATQLQATISPKEIVSQCLDGPEPNNPTLSPSKKKKKRKKLKEENGTHDVKGSHAEAGASSALICNGSNNVLNPPLTPPRRSAELDSVEVTPKSQRTADVSLISPSALNIQPRHKSIPDFLTRPLLNLKPHSDRDSDHEGTPSSSQKKKRKRRRRKKNALISRAVDSKIDETSNVIEC